MPVGSWFGGNLWGRALEIQERGSEQNSQAHFKTTKRLVPTSKGVASSLD